MIKQKMRFIVTSFDPGSSRRELSAAEKILAVNLLACLIKQESFITKLEAESMFAANQLAS
jgi:hypothetical protein